MCIFGVCAIHQPILPGINLKFCNLNTLRRLVTASRDVGGGGQNKDGQSGELITAREIISTAHTQPVTTHHSIEEDFPALRCLLTNLLCTEILL